MKPSEIAKLAAGLGAGAITAEDISSSYGDGVLGLVLGVAGGSIVAPIASSVAGAVLDATGISELLDDIL